VRPVFAATARDTKTTSLLPRTLAGLVGVLLLVGWLGVRGIAFDSVWYDEWRTLVYIGSETPTAPADLFGVLGRVAAQSDALNPPAYYLLLAAWGTLAGTHPAALRYLSVLLGLMTVTVIYRVGADGHTQAVGLAAAAILGTGATFGIYLHEIRAYPLALLAIALHLWTYQRVRRPGAGWRAAAMFLAVLVVLAHTHYTALLMLGGTFLHHLLLVRGRWWVLVLYVLAAAAMVPWLAVALGGGGLGNVQDRAGTALALPQLLETLTRMIGNEIAWVAVVPLLLAFGRGRLLWVYVLVGVVVLLTLNALVPFLCCRRYMLTLLPGLALLLALGLTRWQVLAWATVPLWIATGIIAGHDPTFAHDITNSPRWHFPWETVYSAYADDGQPDDLMLVLLPGGVSDWMHAGPAAYYLPDADVDMLTTWRRDDVSDITAQVAATATAYQRVWTVEKPSWEPYHRAAIHEELRMSLNDCGVMRKDRDGLVRLYAADCP
jgi:uncharacterized membrane protein